MTKRILAAGLLAALVAACGKKDGPAPTSGSTPEPTSKSGPSKATAKDAGGEEATSGPFVKLEPAAEAKLTGNLSQIAKAMHNFASASANGSDLPGNVFDNEK